MSTATQWQRKSCADCSTDFGVNPRAKETSIIATHCVNCRFNMRRDAEHPVTIQTPSDVWTVTVCVRVEADNAQDAKDRVTEDLEALRSSVTLIQADFFMHYGD